MSDSFSKTDTTDPPECFLRILSGPHLGVSVPLLRGDYLIGRSLDSDFVISDELIFERHAVLNVSQGNVNLVSENGGELTFLDGKPVTGEKFQLVPEQVFTLGRTHFTLTEKGGENGPKIDLPVIELPEEEEKEISEDAVDDVEDLESSAASDSFSASDFALEKRTGVPLGSGRCLSIILVSLLVIGFGIYFGGQFIKPYFGMEDQSSDLNPKVKPEELIKVLLEKYPQEKGIRVEPNETTGTITVGGMVTTSGVKTTLIREIRELVPNARVKLSSITSVEAAVRTTLDQMGGKTLATALSTDGTLELSGQLADSKALPKLVERISRDFPTITEVKTDAIWTRDNLIERLTAATKKAGLEDYLSFALEDTKLLVGGKLPTDQTLAFEKLKSDLKAEFEPALTLVDQVEILKTVPVSKRTTIATLNTPAGNPGPKPDSGPMEVPFSEKAGIAGFQNVTVGPISWVVTSEGQKLLEGATLPSGFVVEKITRDYVQLRKHNIIETIYLK